MRFLAYTILAGLVILLLADTNLGRPLAVHKRQLVYQAIRRLQDKGFHDDAQLALRIANSNHFRASRFFTNMTALGEARGANFAYYAYTPVFSRSRVFLGDSFWQAGDIGRSSIIIHELTHIRRHRELFLRGFPRHADERDAYRRQYSTYRTIELVPYGADSMVFWDMMIGMKTYVLPGDPEYARRPDVRWAMRQLDEGGGRPAAGVGVALLYIAVAGILLAGGDRLGSRIGCGLLRRCRFPPLLHLGEWIVLPIALFVPAAVILGFIIIASHKVNPIEALANNLELILLAAFFLTGVLGGFLAQALTAEN